MERKRILSRLMFSFSDCRQAVGIRSILMTGCVCQSPQAAKSGSIYPIMDQQLRMTPCSTCLNCLDVI